MPVHNELGKRMKIYEAVPKTRLVRRMPVAIRLDGKAFHSFTRGMRKPFDKVLITTMQETMKYLCENIQGCVLGYTQSDEITLILIDYKKINSSAWFDNEIQKICSISASMATMAFNKAFLKESMKWIFENKPTHGPRSGNEKYFELKEIYQNAVKKGAMFDSRVFNIPKEEITNLILWRQLDATRNSIQMVGQANFSHRELQGKSCSMIQEMLFQEKGINWNNYPTTYKRGSCCIKETYVPQNVGLTDVPRNRWIIDNEIPIFKNEGRTYIDSLVDF